MTPGYVTCQMAIALNNAKIWIESLTLTPNSTRIKDHIMNNPREWIPIY